MIKEFLRQQKELRELMTNFHNSGFFSRYPITRLGYSFTYKPDNDNEWFVSGETKDNSLNCRRFYHPFKQIIIRLKDLEYNSIEEFIITKYYRKIYRFVLSKKINKNGKVYYKQVFDIKDRETIINHLNNISKLKLFVL